MKAPLASLCLLPLMAAAQAPEPLLRLQLATEASHLDRGLPDWRETTLRLTRQHSPRQLLQGAITRTRRFGLDDSQVEVSTAQPFGPQWTVTADLAHSPTGRVLPRWNAGASAQYEFRPAWLLHAGARHTRYDDATVNKAVVRLEHYFGSFSADLGWSPVRALGTSAHVVDARLTWYWGQDNSLSLSASQGDEATSLGPAGVVLARVEALAVVARYRLHPSVRLNFTAHQVRQGGFYTRRGLGAGVDIDF